MKEIFFQVLEQFETKSVLTFAILASDVTIIKLYLFNLLTISRFITYYITFFPLDFVYEIYVYIANIFLAVVAQNPVVMTTSITQDLDVWEDFIKSDLGFTLAGLKALSYEQHMVGFLSLFISIDKLSETEVEYLAALFSDRYTIEQLTKEYGSMQKFSDLNGYATMYYKPLALLRSFFYLPFLAEKDFNFLWDLFVEDYKISQLRDKYGNMENLTAYGGSVDWVRKQNFTRFCFLVAFREFGWGTPYFFFEPWLDSKIFYLRELMFGFAIFGTDINALDEVFEPEMEKIKYLLIVTNVDVTILVMAIILGTWIFLALRDDKIIQSNWSLAITAIVKFIRNLLITQIGKEAEPYFPFFITVFLTILSFNMIGLIPFNFCYTSQILVTFTISFSVFIGIIIVGFRKQGLRFLQLFVPQNVPNFLLPFLVVIEVISYISRTFSLAIRLFANMVAGHALLHILEDACLKGIQELNSAFLGPLLIVPIAFICIIIVLELGIAFLQTYVFTILFCIYLNDSLKTGGH